MARLLSFKENEVKLLCSPDEASTIKRVFSRSCDLLATIEDSEEDSEKIVMCNTDLFNYKASGIYAETEPDIRRITITKI